MTTEAIIDELNMAIAGIHPSTPDAMLREARAAMVHAREFIELLPKVRPRPVRARGSAQARNTDPGTSHEAAALDMSKMEAEVYAVILTFGPRGCIQDDLLAAFPAEKSQSVMPRIRPLIEMGFVEETGEVRPGKSGKNQRVIRATGKEMTP